MAKDPAFLFYSSDFLTGTLTMSNEQVGKYIRLMCLQHQKGNLTEKDMLHICGAYDEDIFSKFQKDEAGNYFNQRLETEKKKRAAHSKKQKENIAKRWNKSGIYQNDTKVIPLEIVNENEIEVKDIGGTGEKGKFKIDPKMEIPVNVLELAEMNQWTLTNDRNTEFIKKQWKTFLHERSHDPPGKKMQYHRLSDITSYFLNWVRNKHPNNGSHKQTNGAPSGNGKQGTSEARINTAKNW